MSYGTVLRSTLAFAVSLLLSAAAQAQLFRAYLASDGADANPCTLASPCRLLPAALAAVASGGEIWMLDSANYNTSTVTIGKSVTILAVPGAIGSVVAASGGPALSIGASGLTIALRNLVIVPLVSAPGTHGVHMTGASSLAIENSLLANLSGDAVYVGGTGKLEINNSVFRRNNGYAVYIENGARGNISSTKMVSNNSGVIARASVASTTTLAVSDSIISDGFVGAAAFTTVANANTRVFVTRTTIQNMSYALDSETNNVGTSLVAVSASMITGNTTGWYQGGTGAVLRSLGNNHLTDNLGNIGTLTSSPLQ